MTDREMDTFAIDNLPPVEQWPEFSNLAELDYPEKLNGVEYFPVSPVQPEGKSEKGGRE